MNDQADKLRKAVEVLKFRREKEQENASAERRNTCARVIAVTSGKGGVGKTNIAINLAIALGELGYRVIILDADLGLANVDVLFGIIPKYTLVDVIKNRKNILEVLTDGPGRVKFISGGSGVEELLRIDRHALNKFINEISLLDRLADIIIIDTGAGLSEVVLSMIMAADEALLVTTPEPTSITDAYALIKTVSNRDRSKPIKVLVNKAENREEANDLLNRLVIVADKFLAVTLQPVGFVLKDDTVSKAVMQQQPFALYYPRCAAARSLRDVTLKLTEKKTDSERLAGFKGFLQRLAGYMNV